MGGAKRVGGMLGSRRPERTYYTSTRATANPVDRVRAALRDYGTTESQASIRRGGSSRREGGIALADPAGVASLGIEGSTATPATGAVELNVTGVGRLERSDGEDATVLRVLGRSVLSIDTLPATGDTEIIYLQESDGKLYRDTNGEGSWVEVGGVTAYADLTGRPWTLSGNAILFATGTYHLELTRASAQNVLLANRTGDSSARFGVSSDGELFWGPGAGGGDVLLKRLAENLLGLDTGDALRAGVYVELEQHPIGIPASVPSGHTRIQADGDGRPCAIDDSDNVHDLAVAADDVWHLAEGPHNAVNEVNFAYITDPGISMQDGFVDWRTQFSATGGTTPYITNHFTRLSVAVMVLNAVEVLYSKGSNVIFGSAFERAGDTAVFSIRARLGAALKNVAALTDAVFFVCEEGSASNQVQVDLTAVNGSGGTFLSTTWQWWTLSVDMSGWTAIHTSKGVRWGVQVRAGQGAPGTGETVDETVLVDFELVKGIQWAA